MVIALPDPNSTEVDAPATVSKDELARIFRVHKRTITRAINRGEISATRIGNRTRIPMAEVRRLLNGEMPAVA